MAACNYSAPNGATSLLYQRLEDAIGPARALRAWIWIRSEAFGEQFLTAKGTTYTFDQLVATTKAKYGEAWLEAFRKGMKDLFNIDTDANGEPTVEWLARAVPSAHIPIKPISVQPTGQPRLATGHVKATLTNLLGRNKAEYKITWEDALSKVRAWYETISQNPNTIYDLTDIVTQPVNKPGVTGFTPAELANLFASFDIPSNLRFSEEFRALIENTSTWRTADLEFMEVPLLNPDMAKLTPAIEDLKVAILDENGQSTGRTFTSEQTVAAIDTIKTMVWNLYVNTGQLPIRRDLTENGPIYNDMLGRLNRLTMSRQLSARYTEDGGEELRLATIQNLRNVLNSWREFEPRVLTALEGIGMRVKEQRRSPEAGMDESERAKALEDYYDSSFELDPRDTASQRIKLFLASIPVAEVGVEPRPRIIPFAFRPGLEQLIANRTKRATVRVASQVTALGLTEGQSYIVNIRNTETGTVEPFRATVTTIMTARDLAPTTLEDEIALERWTNEAYEEGISNLNIGDALIELEPWQPNPEHIHPKTNFLGYAELADFEDLFQNLLEITAGLPNNYEAMRSAILAEGSRFKPTLRMVVQKLDAAPNEIKREFVKVMSKQYQEFSIMLMSKVRGGTMQFRSINANRGSAINSILEGWRENQKNADVVMTDKSGNRVINQDVVAPLAARGREFAERIALRQVPPETVLDNPFIQNELKPFVRELLEVNGIILPEAAIDHLFRNMADLTKGTSIAGNLYAQFAYTRPNEEGISLGRGMFSVILNKLAGIGEQTIEPERYLLNNNPLYSELTSMRILAKLAYRFSPRAISGSHPNSEGKTIYDFGHKTHLSDTIWLLNNREQAGNDFRARLRSTFLGSRNWLLEQFTNPRYGREIALQYVDGLRDEDKKGSTGIVRSSMSSREQLVFAMGQFQNSGYATGNYISLTHSDKTTTPMFNGVPKIRTQYEGLSTEAANAVYNTFLGEYERIVAWYRDHNTKNDSFNKGGGLYYTIPYLNYDALVDAGYPRNQINMLWQEPGIPVTSLSPSARYFVLQVFQEQWLNPEVTALVERMKDESFDELRLIDDAYLSKRILHPGNNVGVLDVSRRKYNPESGLEDGPIIGKRKFAMRGMDPETSQEQAWDRILTYAAKDFLSNYFVFHTGLSAMMYGDPALTYKPAPSDTRDYHRVESSMKEYQKRLAKDIAPGSDPTWDDGDDTYTTLTIQDDERFHAYLQHLYSKPINASDAQEFTTVREHLYVMKANGVIPDTIYHDMVAIIDAGLRTPDKYYEFTDPSHLAVIMQIMKPVSVSHNFDEVPGMDTIQYIKSSSMPLYPPVTKLFQLDNFRQAIEGTMGEDGVVRNHIPRINFISAKKEGAPSGKGVKVFDDNGNMVFDVNSPEWAMAKQQISRKGLRIQQEVPYDELKEEILTGSQQNKLITQGIQDLSGFSVRGQQNTITGEQLKAEKEAVRKQLIQLQLDEFKRRVGIGPDGVANPTALLRMLKDEAIARDYPPNDIIMLERTVQKLTAEGRTIDDLAIPLFFNPSATKFESMLMSLIKKIGTVYVPGKSYIQASSAGFKFKAMQEGIDTLTEEQRSAIVWVTDDQGNMLYDGGDLKTMIKGEEGQPNRPAQVLIPFNFVVGDTKLEAKDFMIEKDGKKLLDMSRVPRELIELIGFRIPTQGHNSMLPIEVVGFLPANMGDTIIVPAAITMQMGSDFDVDKLYVYRRPYKYIAEIEALEGETIGQPSRFEPFVDSVSTSSGTPTVSENIQKIYDATPELAKFGTAEQYAAYLGTIFPDSVVKDIKWHGGYITKDDTFKIGGGYLGAGVYFASEEAANEYRGIFGGDNLIPVLLDIRNPHIVDDSYGNKGKTPEEIAQLEAASKDNDAVVYHSDLLKGNDIGVQEDFNDEYKVKNSSQIHILGNAQDIDGFNAYVTGRGIMPPSSGTPTLEGMGREDLLSKYFDYTWAVLTHRDMYEKIMAPLDKPDLKAEAKRASRTVTGRISPYYSIKRQLDDFLSQKDAKVMVGISSNFVTWASITEDKNLQVMKYIPGDRIAEGTWEPDGVDFVPEGETRSTHAYNLSGKGEGLYPMAIDPATGDLVPVDMVRNEDTDEVTLINVETGVEIPGGEDAVQFQVRTKIDDNVSLQSEFLDHAKNRTIDNLNINLHTIHAALALVNLSDDGNHKPTSKHLALFLRQPAVVEAVERLGLSQDSLSTEFITDAFNTIVDEQIRLYARRGNLTGVDWDDMRTVEAALRDYTVLDVQDMTETLGGDVSDLHQAGMLVVFKRLNRIGKEMAKLQSVFKQDPRGPGKNMIEALDTISKRSAVERSFIRGAEAMFDTEQGFVHTVELNTARDTYKEMLPYTGMLAIMNTVAEYTAKRELNVEEQQDVIESFRSYIFSDPELGIINHAHNDRLRLLFGIRRRDGTVVEKPLAARVWEAQRTWGADSYFIKRLRPMQAEVERIPGSFNPAKPSHILFQPAQTSMLNDQENTAAFLELLTSTDETQRRLAEDLVRYAYVTGGISGGLGFLRYIPADYLIALPFASKLRGATRDLIEGNVADIIGEFTPQWIQHNPEKMPKLTMEAMERPNEPAPERFTVPFPDDSVKVSSMGSVLRTASDGTHHWPDYVSIYDRDSRAWRLYKLSGADEYRRIDTLGDSYINEYARGVRLHRSTLIENQALINPEGFEPQLMELEGVRDVKFSQPIRDRYNIPDPLHLVLDQIASDKAVAQHQRVLSEVFADIVKGTATINPITLKLGLDIDGPGMSDGGTITINENHAATAKPSGFARVLNHEVFHSITTPFTVASEEVKQAYPKAWKAFQEVTQSYEEAKAAVIAKIQKAGFSENQIRSALESRVAPESMRSYISLYYSVSTIDEFMAGIISKPELQTLLNEKKSAYKGSSILSRLFKAFADFLNALMRDLGIQLKVGSMLETSVRRTFALIEAMQDTALPGVNRIVRDYAPKGFVDNEAEADRIVAKMNKDFPQSNARHELRDGKYVILTSTKKMGFDEDGYSLDDGYEDVLPWDKMTFDDLPTPIKGPGTEKIETPTPEAIERIYVRVQERIQEIEASIAKDTLTPNLMGQRRLLSEMKTLSQGLKASKDFAKIPKLAIHGLDWADSVHIRFTTGGDDVTISEVMTAYRLITLWSDVLRMVYTNTDVAVDDVDLGKVQQIAVELEATFASKVLPATMKKIASQKLTDQDFAELRDISQAEAFGLSVERYKHKITQEVALTIQNTNRNYLEDGDRLVKRIAAFETKVKVLASKRNTTAQAIYEKMFQKEGHWGLINRYSSAFYRWKTNLRNKLEKHVDNAMSTIEEGPRRDAAIRNAYASYWDSLRHKAGYFDIRVFYNEDGTKKPDNDPKAVAYYADMVVEYGEELASQILREADAKFQRYVTDQKMMIDMLDAQVTNGLMKAEDAEAEKKAWDLQHSPFHKMNTREAIGTNKPVSISEKYLLLVPHMKADDGFKNSFWDNNFAEIQKDDELKSIYNDVKEFMDEFTANLPHYVNNKLGPHFLPAIKQKLVSDIANVPMYVKHLPAKLLDQLTATEYEEYMQGRDSNRIPVMYTKDPLSDVPRPSNDLMGAERDAAWAEYKRAKEAKLATYTKDLPRILELFGLMSTHYKHFSDAKDAIDLGMEVVKKVDKDMRNGLVQVEQNGQRVTYQGNMKNTLDSLQYTIDSLMFKRTKNLEGKIADLHFRKDKSVKVRPIKEIKRDIEETNKLRKDHRITDEEYDNKMLELNAELNQYEVKKLYTSKTGDFIITWTQLKALSYNPVSAFANLSFGIISAGIHASGGEDYTWKDMTKAWSIMMNSTGKSLRLTKLTGNNSAMHKTASKILALMDRMGIMGDLVDSDYGNSNLGGRKSAIKEALSPYALLRNGDYFIKGLNMVAVLLNQQVTINGKQMSAWEAFDDAGRFKGIDETWQSEDVTKQKNFQKLKNKVIGVVKINMGNQDKSSPLMGKKTILGRLVSQFRLSWFTEGLATRFETERSDTQLGRLRKGRYRTYADLGFTQSVLTILKQTVGMLPGVSADPFSGITLTNGKDMSTADKANMRKNFAEIGWFLFLSGSIMALAHLAESFGDDESKKRLAKFAMNLAIRNYQDVAMYSSTSVLDQITGSVVPAMSTINDVDAFIRATGKYLTDDEYEFERWLLKLTKAGFIPPTTLYNRYRTLTEKDISDLAR